MLENDDIRFSAADVLWIQERTGVRLIFDYQHFWCLNPERLDMRDTLERFVASWPAGVRPKVHFSSPRTELQEIKQKITSKQRAAARAGTTKNKKSELLKAPVKRPRASRQCFDRQSGLGMPISPTRLSSRRSCGWPKGWYLTS